MLDAAQNAAATAISNGQAAQNIDSGAATGSGDDAELAALQKSVADVEHKATALTTVGRSGNPSGWWSTHDAMTMSTSVLIFGVVVIAIAAFRAKKESTLEEALRLYGTIMVITMAVFLVVAGYDDKQIAAPLGLLGTIVGYLLGRTTKTDPANPPEPPAK